VEVCKHRGGKKLTVTGKEGWISFFPQKEGYLNSGWLRNINSLREISGHEPSQKKKKGGGKERDGGARKKKKTACANKTTGIQGNRVETEPQKAKKKKTGHAYKKKSKPWKNFRKIHNASVKLGFGTR